MSDKKTFDTFIFDLDGTILDTLPDLVVVTNEALREQGFPERTHDEVLSFVGNGLVALMYQAVPENTPKDIADQAVACWKRFNLEYDNHLTAPYPHVLETLAELRRRGCKLGVLSNKFDGGVHKIIAQCLPGLFDAESRTRRACCAPSRSWAARRSAPPIWATHRTTSWSLIAPAPAASAFRGGTTPRRKCATQGRTSCSKASPTC